MKKLASKGFGKMITVRTVQGDRNMQSTTLDAHCVSTTTSRHPISHKIIITIFLVHIWFIKHFEFNAISQQSAHTSEAFAKLVPFLGAIGDKFKFCTKSFIICNDPLNKWNIVFN